MGIAYHNDKDWGEPWDEVAAGDAPAIAPALPDGAENRMAPRFTLLLRCAKLIADGREFVCVLRDASSTGVKVRLFHPLPEAQAFALELPDGSRHAIEPVWARGGHAGFRFSTPIDVTHAFEDGAAGRPRRQLRIEVQDPARIVAHGATRQVRLVNLSQQGACIECDEHLMLREQVRIESDLIPPVIARVCWRSAPRYGLVFETGFSLDELAGLIARAAPGLRGV